MHSLMVVEQLVLCPGEILHGIVTLPSVPLLVTEPLKYFLSVLLGTALT